MVEPVKLLSSYGFYSKSKSSSTQHEWAITIGSVSPQFKQIV